MKIPLVGAELFHEDGRMEDVHAEASLANAPKNGISSRLTDLWLNVVVHISGVM